MPEKRKQLFIKADGITDDTWMHQGTLDEEALDNLSGNFVDTLWDLIKDAEVGEIHDIQWRVLEMTDAEVEAIPEL
jgi:hypothetical protein